MQHGIQFKMSFSSSKTSLISQFNIWYFVFGNKFFADHFILFFHVTQKRSCMTSIEFLMSLPTPTLFHVLPFQEFFLVHWSTWLQPLWTRTLDCTDPLCSAEETNSRVYIQHVWLLWCFFTSLSCVIHTQSISNCSTLYEKWHARSTIWRFCGLKNRKVFLTVTLRHRNGPLILQCLFTVMSKKRGLEMIKTCITLPPTCSHMGCLLTPSSIPQFTWSKYSSQNLQPSPEEPAPSSGDRHPLHS